MTPPAALPGLLIIDDDPSVLEAYAVLLADDFRVYTALTGAAGLAVMQREAVAVILLDIRLPDMSGLAVLRHFQAGPAPAGVVMLTALNEARLAVEALQQGAIDYLVKPVDAGVILAAVRRALERQHVLQAPVPALAEDEALQRLGWVGTSLALRQLAAQVMQVADIHATVLIMGESGVGKELVARAIHQQSPRRTRPFVAVNCAAMAASMTESELLGHERGAFTGAERRHRGKFEQADTGPLFLDQVEGLSPVAQAVLLCVVQERTLYRVGGEHPVQVDVRLVAATNQDLQQLMEAGTFREDLYYRLHVVPIPVPPLRERTEDIPPLVHHFLTVYNAAYDRQVQGLTPAALTRLSQFPWPGNVRELEHLIARLVATSVQPVLDVGEGEAWLRG